MPLLLKPWVQVLLILLAAALLTLPCLLHGLPASADAPTHVKYQYHFSHQFWNGESYPRWLADENKGYGSPIFLAQYPFPYFVTALLRPITPFSPATRESRELGLFVSLTLAAAGLAAWFWLRKFTHPLAATIAAVVYISLPFILESGIYTRGSIGELCTFIWVPWALSISETIYKKRSAFFALSAVYALFVLSNLLHAILFVPVLTIYAVTFGKRFEPSLFKRALLVLLAQLLGAGIAGTYLIPALVYRHLFDLREMEAILPGYQFALYFLHITANNLRSRVIDIALVESVFFVAAAAWYIWRSSAELRIRICMALVLILGALTLIPNLGPIIIRLGGFNLRPTAPSDFMATMLLGLFLTMALGLLAYCRIAERRVDQRGPLLLWIGAASFFLMLPFSAPVWKAIPGVLAVQFPYRVAGFLCIAVAALVAMAFDSSFQKTATSGRGPSTLVIALAAFGAIAGGFCAWRPDLAFLHPRNTDFDITQDIDPMYRAFVPQDQIRAFAADLGTTPETYDVLPTLADGTLRSQLVNGDCDLKVDRESPRKLLVSSDCKEESRLRIGQLYSPLWKIVPSQSTPQNQALSVSADGLIELPLSPGKQETRLFFDLGPAGRWGTILTEASLIVWLIGYVFFRKRVVAEAAGPPANRDRL